MISSSGIQFLRSIINMKNYQATETRYDDSKDKWVDKDMDGFTMVDVKWGH